MPLRRKCSDMLEKFKQTKFYLGWVKLINDLKPMTWKQRVEHIWEYYKYYLLVVFLAGMTLSIFFTMIISRSKETLVSGIMVNIYMEQEAYNYLTEDYLKDLGGTEGKQIAEMTSVNFGDPFDPTSGEDSYYASQILIARVSGQMLDYMLLDQYGFEYYVAQEVYLDLRKVFTEEELQQWDAEKRLIYAMEEGEERVPVAIIITETQFCKDNMNMEGDIYFALSGSTLRPEMCRNVWERIMAWEKKETG